AFAPGDGNVVNCTFSLGQPLATVTATIVTDRADVETGFTLQMAGEPVTLLPFETATDDAARADLYRIALLPERGFRLLDIVCLGPTNERLPAEITFENQSIAFAPGDGNVVNCTFSLGQTGSLETLADVPLAGKWRGVNQPGRIECRGFTTPLPRSTDDGRIEIKQAGRRIIAKGFGDGRRTRIVLDADAEKPGRWNGKLKVRQQGQGITLDYQIDFVSEKKLTGTMRGDFKVRGRKCTLVRDFVLTYRGK
ncbi:MAG: hypothetical protein ACC726_07460, partial [Chloroflexota bacterium]